MSLDPESLAQEATEILIARIADLEAVVARLQAGWTSAQTENASLRELVRSAYNEGFIEGMKEAGNGGNPWRDSKSFERLDAIDLGVNTGGADGK